MPNHAPWPKETRPVYPTSRFKPNAAITRIRQIVAVSKVRPIASNRNGRTRMPTAAMTIGTGTGEACRDTITDREVAPAEPDVELDAVSFSMLIGGLTQNA